MGYFTDLMNASRKVRNKGRKLNALLQSRNIPGSVYYDRHDHSWTYRHPSGYVDQLGFFLKAKRLIEDGWLEEGGPFRIGKIV